MRLKKFTHQDYYTNGEHQRTDMKLTFKNQIVELQGVNRQLLDEGMIEQLNQFVTDEVCLITDIEEPAMFNFDYILKSKDNLSKVILHCHVVNERHT